MNLRCLLGKHTWVAAVEDLQPSRKEMTTVFCLGCHQLRIIERKERSEEP